MAEERAWIHRRKAATSLQLPQPRTQMFSRKNCFTPRITALLSSSALCASASCASVVLWPSLDPPQPPTKMFSRRNYLTWRTIALPISSASYVSASCASMVLCRKRSLDQIFKPGVVRSQAVGRTVRSWVRMVNGSGRHPSTLRLPPLPFSFPQALRYVQ
ncbi:hypothetical protein CC80DRAFT_570175 [Byssothecium circinans]|uniref:Uncharacterized protein n=1 Tax=Byssothecium circinans TaxID=147558 RepID=A0A6A5UBP1_9PLEO|nr:hypothetical protein CC80DRAFT_570175 [Byssothecium circinans]